MSGMDVQFDPGRIDLVTLDESKNIYKLIVAAAHVTSMGVADEDALRQKLTNYIAVASSGELQRRYPQLGAMSCVIQVDLAPEAPSALRKVASEFEAESSSRGLTLTICEID